MPEGDTIYRAARTLRQALQGRTVIDVRTVVAQVTRLGPRRLIGQRVDAVESRGKHLLISFAPSGLVLHTHMGMNGSWHVYRRGERWRKSAGMARFVVDVEGDGEAWTAVCFTPPVCELLSAKQANAHPSLSSLGPDLLGETVDLVEARRRLDAQPQRTIAESLLDQRVLAGVGNVFKSEVLFIHRVDPWATVAEVPDEIRAALLETATRLLRLNVRPGAMHRVTVDKGAGAPNAGKRLYVYGQARRPCPRCSTPITAARQGEQARVTYWCARCQGAGPSRKTSEPACACG